MLSLQVTVDSKNWDSRSALYVAVSEGHLNVVERLVSDWSATLTLEDRFGNTPLDDAVRERRAEVAEFLVEARAARAARDVLLLERTKEACFLDI